MNDAIGIAPPGPPDFVLDFIRTAGAKEWHDAFSGTPPLYWMVIPICLLLAPLFWSRGVFWSRLALFVYSVPALVALVCFVRDMHVLGTLLGQWEAPAYEMKPLFRDAFARLVVGATASVVVIILAPAVRVWKFFRGRHIKQNSTTGAPTPEKWITLPRGRPPS
jgi:hypothetical protein